MIRAFVVISISGAIALAAPAFAATTTAQDVAMPGSRNAAVIKALWMNQPGWLSVQASGQVDYTPDEVHLTLGVEGEASTASAAAAGIATRANAVIAALKNLGISAADITTTGFNLYYRQAAQNVSAAYVASESVNLKTSVDRAGTAIDTGIRAGANQSYGLTFDTSRRDALYQQAVERAVKNARDLAQAAATAAGVKLGSVTSINVGNQAAPQPVMPLFRAAAAVAAPAPPPVEPGTGTISADVTVTYLVTH
ncbi:MAG: SIMPL domain-containing protein [Candidatus Eremiobacteraeota bacterium]|nr:SIMPL domain-containing protein [Candidatus Eremiobacteraeota bacterium]